MVCLKKQCGIVFGRFTCLERCELRIILRLISTHGPCDMEFAVGEIYRMFTGKYCNDGSVMTEKYLLYFLQNYQNEKGFSNSSLKSLTVR